MASDRVTKNGLMLGCFNIVKNRAPVDTGKLRNSITCGSTDDGFFIEITAPHTVYTEEEWLSPKWNGKTNPNQDWIKYAVNDVKNYLYRRLNRTEDIIRDKITDIEQVADIVTEYQTLQRSLDSNYLRGRNVK